MNPIDGLESALLNTAAENENSLDTTTRLPTCSSAAPAVDEPEDPEEEPEEEEGVEEAAAAGGTA